MPTALIVEDEPEANQLLAMLVQLRGYQTLSAFTGGEALEMAGKVRPDLVFLDLMLPDINGFEVCRALRSSRPTCSIPIVMVTARLAAENRIQGFRAGAADYVPKPYTPDQIFGAMEAADAWARCLTDDCCKGSIAIEARGDVDSLREISRLWSVLLARTAMPEDAVSRLGQMLVDVATRAAVVGRDHGRDAVGTIDYRWDPERLLITLHDPSGSLTHESPMDPEGLGALIRQAGFDSVEFDPASGRVELKQRLTPPPLASQPAHRGSNPWP